MLSRALNSIYRRVENNALLSATLRVLIAISDLIYSPLNKLVIGKAFRIVKKETKGEKIVFEKVDQIKTVEKKEPVLGFYRDTDIVNFMLKYPWIEETDVKRNINYHFSHSRKLFHYRAYDLYDFSNGNKVHKGGVVFLVTKKNDRVLLRICDVIGENVEKAIELKALELAKNFNADRIECDSKFYNGNGDFLKSIQSIYQRESVFYEESLQSDPVIVPEEVHVRFADGDQNYY